MAKEAARERSPEHISDAAVQKATGKSWAEWFQRLDAADASKLDHKGIVAILRERHGLGPWWRQMVTVEYERARGLRKVYETPRGFQVGVSRTFAAPVARVYAAWQDKRTRSAWLGDCTLTIRKATRNKSLRIAWDNGATGVEVNFYAKGPAKCQCAVQHNKLNDRKAVERMRKLWSTALDALRSRIEA